MNNNYIQKSAERHSLIVAFIYEQLVKPSRRVPFFLGFVMLVLSATASGQAPGTPTNLQVDSTSLTQIALSWTAPADDGNGAIEAYNVYRCDQVPGEAPCTPVWIAWVTAGTSFADTHDDSDPAEAGGTSPLAADTTYRYAVAAYRGSEGNWSNEITATTPSVVPPGAPVGLKTTATSTTQISLSWTAPADDGNGAIAAYNVYRCVAPCFLDGNDWIAWVDDGTTFTDTSDDSTSHESGGNQSNRFRHDVSLCRRGVSLDRGKLVQ